MKRESIRSHLRPYSILNRRATTINHAFASAIAQYDDYDDEKISEALTFLGQDPNKDLICVYCDERIAETWDHVYGLVKNKKYFGYGHTLGNLLPCCKECNSKKGNQEWRRFISKIISDETARKAKIKQLQSYFDQYLKPRLGQDEINYLCPDEMKEFLEVKKNILLLMAKADEIAEDIRQKVMRTDYARAQQR